MSLLQYTSKEMYSSTELIRKSKMVFDKLNNNEIEKAVILRDGKPSFMLMDFSKYEDLITEYLALKEELESKKIEKKKVVQEIKEEVEEKKPIEKKELVEQKTEKKLEPSSMEEINNDDLKDALDQIEQLDFSFDKDLVESEIKSTGQELKEFWD